MNLAEWRKSEGISCDEVARRLGLPNDRDGSTIWNWETGRARPDADMVERIVELSRGIVTAEDMHAIRLGWLKAHRPEKFEAQAEAAQ